MNSDHGNPMLQTVHDSHNGAPSAMHYSPKCQDANFIQGYLPENFVIDSESYSDQYKKETIGLALEVCDLCLGEYMSTGECVMFPSSSSLSVTTPVAHKYLQQGLGHGLRNDFTRRLLPLMKKATNSASDSYREILRKRSKGLWWNDSFVAKRSEFLPDEDGAIIYISENDFSNDGTFLVPFYMFAERIARSTATNIQIFITEECYSNYICKVYSASLKDYLYEMYPRALTTIDRIDPTGKGETYAGTAGITPAQIYGRLLLCSHLICATGDMECTYAALMKYGGYSTIMMRGPQRALLEELVNPNLKYLQLISTENVPTLPLYGFQNEENAPVPNMDVDQLVRQFALQSPPDTNECRHLRGRAGHWFQDMEYAKLAQYKRPISFYAGKADREFIPTEDEPFRLPTTYKWVDTLYPDCQTQLVTLEGMCNVMQRLGLRRLLFLGDSLTYHASQSMHKLLGALGDADFGNGRLKGFVYPFECSGGNEIQLQLIRNDELNNLDNEPKNNEPNCEQKGFCWRWLEDYVSNPAPTLVVANTGGHIHDIGRFRTAFDSFVETIDSVNRPDDVVFFRTSVPGHRDCMKKGIKPFIDHHEYMERETKKWNWNMFVKHNNYVDRQLTDRDARGAGRAHIEILDVYPMTVLRPDGHASSPDCGNNCGREDDCLHYSLPGPVDWWNHLLYSNLLDLAREKEEMREANEGIVQFGEITHKIGVSYDEVLS